MNKSLILCAAVLLALSSAAFAQQQCGDDSGGQGGQAGGGDCYAQAGGAGAAGGGADGSAASGDAELDGLSCVADKSAALLSSLSKDVVEKFHTAARAVVSAGENATPQTLASACQQGQGDLDAARDKLKCAGPTVDKLLAALQRIQPVIAQRRGHEASATTDLTTALADVSAEDSLPEDRQTTTRAIRDMFKRENSAAQGRASCQQSVNGDEESALTKLQQALTALKNKIADQGSVAKFKSTARSVLKADDGAAAAPNIYSCLGSQGTFQSDTTGQGGVSPEVAASPQMPKQKFMKNNEAVDAAYTGTKNEVQELADSVKQASASLQAVRGRVPCR